MLEPGSGGALSPTEIRRILRTCADGGGGLSVDDADVNRAYANGACCRWTGLSPDEVAPGTPYIDIVTMLAERNWYGSAESADIVAERLMSVSIPQCQSFDTTTPDGTRLNISIAETGNGGMLSLFRRLD